MQCQYKKRNPRRISVRLFGSISKAQRPPLPLRSLGSRPAPAIERLGIAPHIWGSECATGLGSDDNSFAGTSFPQPLGQAATWDKPLIKRLAVATHVELRAQHNEDTRRGVVKYHHGINCWSPVINIMRHWAWGRNLGSRIWG